MAGKDGSHSHSLHPVTFSRPARRPIARPHLALFNQIIKRCFPAVPNHLRQQELALLHAVKCVHTHTHTHTEVYRKMRTQT